jgi:hypothetical protein
MIHFKRMLKENLKLRALVYYLAFAMTLISVLPRIASASAVPTRKAVEGQSNRQADLELITKAFNSENGQTALKQVGITNEQFHSYLGQLSDAQLKQVADMLRAQIPAGGDAESVVWALILLILVLFLIFLLLDITGVYKLPHRRG